MIGVCIVTYNEEKYIARCIESVLSQKCTEPFRIYIGEDCSTDKTLDICKKLVAKNPSVISLIIRNKNYGLVKNTIELLRQIESEGCEYIAILDGDDYWIDDYKLEKQVSFLKEHSDFGLVHTNMHLLHNNKWYEINRRKNVKSGYLFNNPNSLDTAIGNCTALFRSKLLDFIDLDYFVTNNFMSVDYAMYKVFLKYTKFKFLDDFTAVWRRGHSSVSNTNNLMKQIAYLQNGVVAWQYFNMLFPEEFPINERAINEFVDNSSFKIAFKMKNFLMCKKYANSPNIKIHSVWDKIKHISTKNKCLFYFIANIFLLKFYVSRYYEHIKYRLNYSFYDSH